MDWAGYFAGTEGRPPRPLVERAVGLAGTPGRAIDLGCGAGVETRYLLDRGWHVLAVDGELDTRRRLATAVPAAMAHRLDVRIADFRDLDGLPPVDLVHASLSLPFCPPESFNRLWLQVTGSLRPGGLLAADLFGDRDSWAVKMAREVTFHSRADVDQLLAGLEVVDVVEQEHDRPAFNGPKHWHVFQVFARRPV